jgi:hypothetical protein
MGVYRQSSAADKSVAFDCPLQRSVRRWSLATALFAGKVLNRLCEKPRTPEVNALVVSAF